ncbi:hypothetical protein [Algibacter sp. R77976]|uniref:hypothetical protein n=1 Tax=Algibacter sp. R77976 TaxID=3093873 RepID=UPI0037CB75BA
MKKVIGIVGVFVLALSMFFSTTSLDLNDIQNVSLSDLALISTASAEDDEWVPYSCPPNALGYCSITGQCHYSYYLQGC